MKKIFLSSAAALMLVACGGNDAETPKAGGAEASAAKLSKTASPIDKRFVLKGAKPLDVEAFFALLPEQGRPSYADASFDDTIGATVITDLAYEDEADGSIITIDRAELYGVDMGAIEKISQKIESDAPADANAAFEKLLEKVRLFGVQVQAKEGGDTADFSIAGIELDGLRFRASSLGKDEKAPLYFLNALNLKGVYVKDLLITAQEKDSAFALAAPDWRLEGFGGGKFDRIAAYNSSYSFSQSDEALDMLEGVGQAIKDSPLGAALLSGANQKVEAASFVWQGFDLSGLLEYGLKGEEPPADAKNLIQLGEVNIADANTYISDKLFSKVSEANISAVQSTWLVPSKVTAVTKAKYDFSAYAGDGEDALLTTIKEHGLDAVEAVSNVSWDWNAKSGKAEFVTAAAAPSLADYEMSFNLEGFKSDTLKAAMAADDASALAPEFKIGGFNTTLKDKALLDAIFAIAGLQMNSSGPELRQSAPAMIRLLGVSAMSVNPLYAGYVNSFADFVAKGGSLSIDASPKKPVPLATLSQTIEKKPDELGDVLGLTVTHKK